MSKIEECWVIQRDDGSFFARTEIYNFNVFCDELGNAEICSNKEVMENIIEKYNLQNCRPVKAEIRVVGEGYE